MRLVESVPGELGHRVEDLAGLRGFDVVGVCGTFDELGPLLLHHGDLLLAHGPAQNVGFTQGVTGQDVGRPLHLLLVHHDPVGLL